MKRNRAILFFVAAITASVVCTDAPAQQPPPTPQQSAPPAAQPPSAPPAVQTPAPPVPRPENVVVVDPGHGGTDAGARGSSGILEKDVVLQFALALRNELQKQGVPVVLTRERDENPSFDDRAALANSYRGALFVTLHASSTGAPGTVRSYYFGGQRQAGSDQFEKAKGLVKWDEAQLPFADSSRMLAAAVQTQLKQKFSASPEAAAPGSLRQLRSVTAPAVAVEVASVSVGERKALEQMVPALAEAVAKALTAFRVTQGVAH